MNKTQRSCMQGMARANSKAIFQKLFILTEYSSLYNFIASICVVIEQGMTNILHVYAYLMGTTGFQDTLHERNITESFHNLVMSNSLFAVLTLRISFK